MSDFRGQFCKGSLMKVHYPKLYNMAHFSRFECFTASKGSNNYFFSMLYTKTLSAIKNEILIRKKNDIFSIFVQNIDCGYTLKPPVLTSTHNLCFGLKKIAIPLGKTMTGE